MARPKGNKQGSIFFDKNAKITENNEPKSPIITIPSNTFS